MAVNPVTNKVYVANRGSNNVTVIDGATNATSTVAAGTNPEAVAVNPVTNKIYVANRSTVTVINGATNGPSTVPVGSSASDVAVNAVTNTVYVTNWASHNVTVINGATNAANTVAAGAYPAAVAVNPVSNKVYVANTDTTNVNVVDGITSAVTTVAVGTNPLSLAVNPVTNRVYVVNYSSHDVTVIDEQNEQPVPLTVAITPLPSDRTSSPNPTFTFTAASAFAPNAPSVRDIYYQVDTVQGAWLKATGSGATRSGITQPLQLGVHVLYAFAADSQMADSVNTGSQSSTLIGGINTYVFLVDGGTLQGRVTWGGNPLAGVSVSVPECPLASTEANGTYSVAGVAPGTHRVTFSMSGYAPATRLVATTAGATTRLDVSLAAITALFEPAASSRPTHGKYATFHGHISPPAAAGAGTATITLSRRVTVTAHRRIRRRTIHYKKTYYKTVTTKTMSGRASDGYLSYRYKPKTAGKWKMSISYTGTDYTNSGPVTKSVTVR